jgi:hypothetical protein
METGGITNLPAARFSNANVEEDIVAGDAIIGYTCETVAVGSAFGIEENRAKVLDEQILCRNIEQGDSGIGSRTIPRISGNGIRIGYDKRRNKKSIMVTAG